MVQGTYQVLQVFSAAAKKFFLLVTQFLYDSFAAHCLRPRFKLLNMHDFFGRMRLGISGARAVCVLAHAFFHVRRVTRVEGSVAAEKNINKVRHVDGSYFM
jgi:hypothetical protein